MCFKFTDNVNAGVGTIILSKNELVLQFLLKWKFENNYHLGRCVVFCFQAFST